MPGIVIVHSHHNSKSQSEIQDMGILLAPADDGPDRPGERLQKYQWNREHYHSLMWECSDEWYPFPLPPEILPIARSSAGGSSRL